MIVLIVNFDHNICATLVMYLYTILICNKKCVTIGHGSYSQFVFGSEDMCIPDSFVLI